MARGRDASSSAASVPGRGRTLVGIGVAVLAGGAIVFAAGRILLRNMYFDEAAELRQAIDDESDRLSSRRRSLRAADDVRDEVSAFVGRSLGPTTEVVDHAIRRELLAIAAEVGLQGASASTSGGKGRAIESPQKRAFPKSGIWREMRNEPDLVEYEAGVGGVTDFAGAIDLLDRLAAAPWPKRIDAVRLTPSRDSERVEVRVALTTAFVPGRDPAAVDPEILAAIAPASDDPERLAVVRVRDRLKRRLIERDPFQLPKPEIVVVADPVPEVVEPDPPAPVDPGPPPFPWSAWTLTGVAEGPGGPEAWLRHGPDGRSVVLTTGATFETVTLADVLTDRVVFDHAGDQTEVVIGGSLEPLAGQPRRRRGRGGRGRRQSNPTGGS